jgi:pimeloyl-ACP methyl ester carboxylesterase
MDKIRKEAILHDGAKIDIEISGKGPTILLPVNPVAIEGQAADEMRKWGVDPALGRHLIDGLNDTFRVIAFDYENHVIAHPKPDTLTPDNIANDFLAIADAAGVEKFAYYGYSWLALSGLQLGIRTDRLSALLMGGYPPIDGPYHAMLAVTKSTYNQSTAPKTGQKEKLVKEEWQSASDYDWDAAEVTMNGDQTKQFLKLYETLSGFNDREVQDKLEMPRLTFAGSKDFIDYGEKWGDVRVEIAGPLINKREELESLGWDVKVVEGGDHMTTMQPSTVLPIIKDWLIAKLN